MNDFKFLPDDPKLTAYALGELEGEERAAVEAALRDDPAARAAVEEIRATAGRLQAALASEAAEIALPHDEKDQVQPRAAIVHPSYHRWKKLSDAPDQYKSRPGIFSFPRAYLLVGGLAAACFALVVALRTPSPHPAPAQKVYTQVDLASAPTNVAVELPKMAEAAAEVDRPAEVKLVLPPAAPAVASLNQPAPFVDTRPVPQTLSLLEQAKGEQRLLAQAGSGTGGASQALAVGASKASADETTKPPVVAGKLAKRAEAQLTGASGESAVFSGGGQNRPEPTSLSVAGPAPAAAFAPAAARGLTTGGAAGAKEEIVMLSPFMVSTEHDTGYGASSTLAGSRIRGRADRDSLPPPPRGARFGANTEAYAYTPDNDFLDAAQNPLSTFAIDVDTASYSNVRRFLQDGRLPPHDAVRIEELVNYFPYRYPAPAASPAGAAPFAASLEVAEAPWAPTHRLVRIGLKGREVAIADRPAANLVFLLDVSGSMSAPNRLPLVKESMRLLVGKLRADDRVAIVTYAGESGLALPSTPAAKSREILEALDALAPGGSTNGAMGIQLAYDVAKANFVKGGINRVILCTDGDFNVGVTSEGELVRLIEEKAKSGVALTVLGFGMGNLQDSTLEKLADKGDGNYGYVDTRREAEKLLVEQVNGTLLTIAKDVRIQVEFNPAKVASYRLIGYENRLLKKEDFNDDKVDAGEIGAGHTVTALYEIVPVGTGEKSADRGAPPVDEPRYTYFSGGGARVPDAAKTELLTVKVRYKKPDGFFSKKLEFPVADATVRFENATADFKFAAAVAEFGMLLRDSPHKGTATMNDVIAWAAAGSADDPGGYRGEFLDLARKAQALLRGG